MNRKLKCVVAMTIITMLTSQTFMVKGLNNVMAASVQSTSSIQNDALGGFKLISQKEISDIKSTVYIYEHAKSGAKLIYLKNDSDNKMMCVNFRTPSKDNTGVNHVIEHSVLEGSEKYPVKDLMNQLMKQSMSTFLNAFTTDNSTSYPVASKNDKDFQNLMSVYLDSVFHPEVLKDKRIFEQEGIRYELNSPSDELKYNGIVYNEMKGDYSSPDWILSKSIQQSLFPDTSYKYEAGGLPDDIPQLTYDELLKTYNNNYNPANSYFYLYGKMDINKELKFIGDNYLNKIPKKQSDTELKIQKPFTKMAEKTVPYSIEQGVDTKNKTYLSLNYVLDKATNKDVFESFSFISALLGGLPSSPITKALKDNGFGENITVKFNPNEIQPTLSIIAQNVDENQKDKFKKVVTETLQGIVKNGIDKDLLNAVEKRQEYAKYALQGNYALSYNNLIMMSWLYGGDPTAYLDINPDYSYAKENLQNLINKYLVNNTHSSLVVLKPEAGLENKNEASRKAKLDKYKASLSKTQIDQLVKNTQDLKKWQETSATKEEIDTLPTLTPGDINKDVKEYKTVEKSENGVKVLQHPINTNGFDISSMYFDTTKVPQDKLGYIYLLSDVLGNIDTKNYSKEKLAEQEMINGNIAISTNCLTKNGDNDEYFPKMVAQISSVNDNLSSSFDLAKEIIFNSNLNDKTRLKEIIKDTKTQLEELRSYDGGDMASGKVDSYMSEYGKYQNYANDGLYSFICDLDKNFDSKSDEIVKNLQEVRNSVFNKNYMIASFTGSEDDYKNFSTNFNKVATLLKSENLQSYKYSFDSSKINEGLIIPSKVQYVVKGGELEKSGYKQNGKYQVLQNVLNSYLWDKVRVNGGAYGTGITINNGNVILSSSQDPNLKETLDAFDSIPDYLKNFNVDEKQMNNYIISAASKDDNSYDAASSILGPAGDGITADSLYLNGIKQSDIQKQRQELISTTEQDIRNFAPVMDAVLKQNYLCVAGSESKIEENSSNFMTIKNVLTGKEQKGNIMTIEKKENAESNKTWAIKFTKDLDDKTVNTANVYVLDDKNSAVKVTVSYDKDNKTINVSPVSKYDNGKKYTLFIKDILSQEKDGKVSKLIAPVKMEFTIKK